MHVVVRDSHDDHIHLAISNWFYFFPTRQILSDDYIKQRLTTILPLESNIVLLDPWLKKCGDGEISLRCESPNSHIILMQFETRYSDTNQIDIQHLRRWGTACLQANDSLGGIEMFTFGLEQLDIIRERESESLHTSCEIRLKKNLFKKVYSKQIFVFYLCSIRNQTASCQLIVSSSKSIFR